MLPPVFSVFRGVLIYVKQWAKARGVYGNAYGFLGGISWTLLVAKICRDCPGASPTSVLQQFFISWSKYNWSLPVELEPRAIKGGPFRYTLDMEVWDVRKSPAHMAILTPTYPSMNTSHNVSHSGFHVLKKELTRAAGLCQEIVGGSSATTFGSDDQEEMSKWWPLVSSDIADEFHQDYPCLLQLDVLAAPSAQQNRWLELIHASLRHIVRHVENGVDAHVEMHLLPRNLLKQLPSVGASGGAAHAGGKLGQGAGRRGGRGKKQNPKLLQRQLLGQFWIGLRVAPESECASAVSVATAACSAFAEQVKTRARQGCWYSADMEVGFCVNS